MAEFATQGPLQIVLPKSYQGGRRADHGKEPLQYDVESLFPLLAGVRPQDFPEPRLEAPQAEQALPPPDFPPELVDPPVFPKEKVSAQPIADGADGMDVDASEVGEGPEPMTIDILKPGLIT